MKVIFKKPYFRGNRYRKGVVHDVPDEWKDTLPSGAKIQAEPKVVEEVDEVDEKSPSPEPTPKGKAPTAVKL